MPTIETKRKWETSTTHKGKEGADTETLPGGGSSVGGTLWCQKSRGSDSDAPAGAGVKALGRYGVETETPQRKRLNIQTMAMYEGMYRPYTKVKLRPTVCRNQPRKATCHLQTPAQAASLRSGSQTCR